jgi:hypothetical protein
VLEDHNFVNRHDRNIHSEALYQPGIRININFLERVIHKRAGLANFSLGLRTEMAIKTSVKLDMWLSQHTQPSRKLINAINSETTNNLCASGESNSNLMPGCDKNKILPRWREKCINALSQPT